LAVSCFKKAAWTPQLNICNWGGSLLLRIPPAICSSRRPNRKRGQPEQTRGVMAMVAKLNEEQAEKRQLAFQKNQ
jgi:hypothetical protein